MDKLDGQILAEIQDSFPVSAYPFHRLGKKVGLTEMVVRKRIEKLKKADIIQRIGASFDYRKLNYRSTLIAMMVPERRLEEVALIINSYPGVTHNYVRQHKYNLWFTLLAPSKNRLEEILTEIKRKTGISRILNLPIKKLFKLKVHFSLYGSLASR